MSVVEITTRLDGGGSGSSGPFYNIWHIFLGTPDTAAVNGAIGALKTFYQSCSNSFVNSTSITVGAKTVLIDQVPPLFVASTPQTVIGTGGAAFGPPQVAMVVSWKSVQATRAGRGRTYLGPLSPTTFAVSGSLSSGSTSSAQSAGTNLIAAIKALDSANYLAVYHRRTRTNTPITGCSVSVNPYTQRRRAL